jgi:iron(III) transport system ATP-binding protein
LLWIDRLFGSTIERRPALNAALAEIETPTIVSMTAPLVTIRGISKTFPARPEPVRALRNVNLSVRHGEFTAILGASGCGKTTLLRVIAGLDRADRGEIALDGRVLSSDSVHIPPERRDIGIVPQEGALFPHLNVGENVGFGLGGWRSNPLSPRARRDRADRVNHLLEMVGLAGYAKRRPDELSGGQQQRVALARALAPSPKLILLDEPFSALDAGLRVEVRDEVRRLLRETGQTAILVTHDQEEALSLADQVVVMRGGEIAQVGSPNYVYSEPADPSIAAFVGDAVFLPARMAGLAPACATCALGMIAVRESSCSRSIDGHCALMLRPEQFLFANDGAPARVIGSNFFGHDGLVRLRMGEDGAGPQISVRCAGAVAPAPGELVHISIAGAAMAYPAELAQAGH